MAMRTSVMIAAAALIAAGPAYAQNEAAPDNMTDMTANSTASNTGGAMTPTNEAAPVAAAPSTMSTNTTTASTETTAPVQEKKSFPWGIIGLLGLLGFIPRARRRG